MKDYIKISYGKWLTQTISIVFFIVGARYLSLDEYGIFGILSVFIAISDYLSRETLESLVVSKKISCYSALRISFEIIILTIIIILFGSYFFINDDSYQIYIYLLLIIFSLHWISAPFKAKLIELNFYSKYSFIYAISSFISVVIGIYLLNLNYGVLALLVQQIILNSILLINSYYFVFSSKENLGVFNRTDYKEFFSVLPSSVVFVISARLDILIVSNYLGLIGVGIYSFCRRVFQIIQDIFVGGLDKLLLKKDNNLSLKTFLLIQVIIFSLLYLISILSISLIPIVIGEKWSVASQYLLLMIPGATYMTSIALLRSKYIVEEKYRLLLKVRFLELFISILLLIPISLFSFLWIVAVYFSFRFFIISFIMTNHILTDKLVSVILGICFGSITYITHLYIFQKI